MTEIKQLNRSLQTNTELKYGKTSLQIHTDHSDLPSSTYNSTDPTKRNSTSLH